jgi:hypothetical protein
VPAVVQPANSIYRCGRPWWRRVCHGNAVLSAFGSLLDQGLDPTAMGMPFSW